MPLTQLAPPYPIFTDKNGDPLDNGYLYFGEANQNPETNPVTVYYDRALTQPVAQPVRTSNGYVMRNGSPALIYANEDFSVTVRDKNGALVIYSPVGFGIVPGISSLLLDNASKDLASLLADTSFSYDTAISGSVQVSPGDILRTLSEGYAYEVAASGAADHDAITAGGVKLYWKTVGYGQDQTQYRTGGGAVRQTAAAGGWSFINDTTHEPWGWAAVSPVALTGTNLRVTYDFTADEVGTFSVTPDESYAAIGLTVGASVGKNIADISGFAPISGRITPGASGIIFSSTSGNVISQVVDQAAGTITVTHLTQTHTDSAGSAVMVTPAASPSTGAFCVTTQTKTGFVLQYTDNLACRIACTNATPGSEVFTVSQTNNTGISAAWISGTNCVRVTFPDVGNNKPDANVTLSRDSTARYIYTTDTQGGTTCDIFFYDLTGTQLTAANTNMIFHFSKPGKFPRSIPGGSGYLGSVQRDMVRVDFNQLNGPSANLWLSFAHPY